MITTSLLMALSLAAQDPAPQGVTTNAPEAVPGYTLLAPLRSTETVLLDTDGAVVHKWTSEFTPGNAVELLPNGNLLRCGKVGGNERFQGGGEGGLLEEFTWDGELVWSYDLSSDELLHHHDFEVLPNGNVLVLIWQGKTREEAIAAGRRENSVSEKGLWPDAILELLPKHPDGAEIVWSWSSWDHLVQNTDSDLPNYGDPAKHLHRLDVNIGAKRQETPETEEEREERLALEQQLAAMGYSGDDEDDEPEDEPQDRGRERDGSDWMHTNSVDYDPELDLIVISARSFNEVLVIDHSTTTAEAAGSTGGRYGKGGDILWRWGNSANHGGSRSQQLFGQHDARWTRESGAVAITVYNNGRGRPDGDYSSVDLMMLPLEDGKWITPEGGSEGSPAGPAWSYSAPNKDDFFSSHISGAEPLTSDVILVCEGAEGRIFQVARSGEILWDFTFPKDMVPITPREERGDGAGRGGPGRGERPDGPREPRGEAEGDDSPPGGGRGRGRRRGGPGGGRGGDGISIFRAVHVPLDHPALAQHLDK